jgi:hypothetical protein
MAPRDREHAMRRISAIVAVCMLVASCAGTIKEGMSDLEGQPLSAVIAKIGLPIGERRLAGTHVYIWGTPEMSTKETKGACQIRAIMNGDVVGSLEYEGDETLCQQYAGRLRR